MAIKYRVSYKDTFNNQWRIDIDIKGYSGAIISDIRGSSSICDITHEGDSNNPFEPFFSSNATISLYNSGNIDVSELQNLQDRDATVSVYKSGSLYWKGFAIPDGIEESIIGHNPEVIITATDGLEMLEGLEFNRGVLPLTDHSPINYISLILGSSNNLGLWLPIKWVDSLRDKVNDQEVLQGADWAVSEDGFIGEDGVRKNCDYILRGAVESIGGRIYQSGGEWKIDRLNDLTPGNLPFRRRATITSTITTGSENRDKVIGNGGYRLLTDSRPISTIHPALKRLKVTYTHDQFKNIIPNGSQDKWEFLNLDLLPQDWGIINKKPYQSVEVETTIDARSGNSARLKNDMAGSQATAETALRYSMAKGSTPAPISIPIDTSLMYNEMMFSFKFMIESAESDIVDEEQVVRRLPITINGNPYSKTVFPLRFLVSMKITKPTPSPQGNVFQYRLNEFGNWVLFSQSDDTNVDFSATIDADFNSDNVVKINDIISTTGSRGFMKLPEALIDMSPDVKCELRVEFFVVGKTTVRIDDISVEVNGNNEVYQTERSSTNFTDTEEYEMVISSSFNGFYISNYMSSWDSSDSEYYYKDGTDEGSLTYINSRSKMRMRGVPNTILDVNIHGDGFSADSIISLPEFAGKKFMPLYSSIDTVSGDTKLVLYEIRNTFFGDIVTKMVPSGSLTSAGGNWTGGGSGGGGITPIETLESVTTRGNVTTKIIEARGVRSGSLLELPDNEPLLADRRAGKTYIYANGEGSGSTPSPVLGNLEDLQNVQSVIANGKYLQKIAGVWTGADISFPSLAGYALESWVTAGFEPKFTKNTAFNKNFGVVAGTVAQGNDSRINNGQTAFGWGNHAGKYVKAFFSSDGFENIDLTSQIVGQYISTLSSNSTGLPSSFSPGMIISSNRPFGTGVIGSDILVSRNSDKIAFRGNNTTLGNWREIWHDGNLRSDIQNDARYSQLGHTHTFASLTSKPTTIVGYGITDAVTINTKQIVVGAKYFSGAIGLPNNEPTVAQRETGATYIYANGSGSGSAPAPTLSNLEDLQNVQSTIANNKYLQKINGTWTGVDITFPSLSGYALESWVTANFEPKFAKNTAFNKNFGTVAGTVAQGNDSRINNGQTAFGWGRGVPIVVTNPSGSASTDIYSGDLNEIPVGTYASFISSASINLPFANVGSLLSLSYSTNLGAQLLFGRTGNDLAFRGYNNSVLSSWKTIWHDGNLRSNAQNDSRYVLKTGDTMTGDLTITGRALFQFGNNTWYRDYEGNDRLYFANSSGGTNGVMIRASGGTHRFQIRGVDNTVSAWVDMNTGDAVFNGKLTAPSIQARFNNATNFINLATPFTGGFSIVDPDETRGLHVAMNNGTGDTVFQSKRSDAIKSAYNLLFQNRGGGFGIGVDAIPANMKFQIGYTAGAILVGSVTLTKNSSNITGLYTRFLNYFKKGQRIQIKGVWYYVASVNSATSITISTNSTTLEPHIYLGETENNLDYFRDPINTFSVSTNGDVVMGDKLTVPLVKVTRTLGIPTGVPPIGDREPGITYLYALT